MGKFIEYLKLTNKTAEKYHKKIGKTNLETKFQYNPFKEKNEKTFVWVERE
ncbi:hypothetical protein IKA92_04790 [bacterium]|nr:hypothetical protein [bacterium]